MNISGRIIHRVLKMPGASANYNTNKYVCWKALLMPRRILQVLAENHFNYCIWPLRDQDTNRALNRIQPRNPTALSWSQNEILIFNLATQYEFSPFTPKSAQFQIAPEPHKKYYIQHTVWRVWLVIGYSDKRLVPILTYYFLSSSGRVIKAPR